MRIFEDQLFKHEKEFLVDFCKLWTKEALRITGVSVSSDYVYFTYDIYSGKTYDGKAKLMDVVKWLSSVK